MVRNNDADNEECHVQDADLIDEGVKVISGKTNNDIKKMMKTFRENQEKCEPDESTVMELYESFSDILSTENVGAVH